MPIQSSFPSVCDSVITSNKNIIEILGQINSLTLSQEPSLNLTIYDENGILRKFAVPSFNSLKSEIDRLNNNINSLYGIDSTGEWWIKNSIIRMEGDEIKATRQEIETALINEAKKRGLWDNPNIICLFCNEKNTTEGLAVCFSNNMLWGKHGKIFDNGTWEQ